jgi:polyhydroxybutyrate depolymerase
MLKDFIFFILIFKTLLFLNCDLHGQQERTLMHNGIERSFIQFTPSNYDSDSTYSLVLVLHGFLQDAESIMNYSKFNELAEGENFIVVYPNGINNAWNTQSGFPGGSTADDIGFISTLIDLLLSELNIDARRVFSCGFSAGGFMSYLLACELQDKLAAIASVAGTYSQNAFDNCEPVRPFPVLHIHGTEDIIVPPDGGFSNISVDQTLSFWVGKNGCMTNSTTTEFPDEASDGTRVEREDFPGCNGMAEVQYFRIINGGHTWPGASVNSGFGVTSQNLDASKSIWEFFSRHTAPFSTHNLREIEESTTVFPNPATSEIHVEVPKELKSKPLQIIDANGKEVYSAMRNEVGLRISVGDWPTGVYWLLVKGQEPIPIVIN